MILTIGALEVLDFRLNAGKRVSRERADTRPVTGPAMDAAIRGEVNENFGSGNPLMGRGNFFLERLAQ